MDNSHITIEYNKTTYIFDLTNTQNINNISEIAPYISAVSNFIEANSLPSFVYPEVYEFFAVQRNLKAVDNGFDNFVFEYSNIVSLNEEQALILAIRQMVKEKTSYFQMKNS